MPSADIFVPETVTSGRGNGLYLSGALWGRFPFREAITTPWKSHFFYEDFSRFPIPATNATTEAGQWNIFLSDGGAIADAGIANVSAITVTSNDDNEAVVMALKNAGIRITADSGREVFFEAAVRSDTISNTKNGWFLGLFEPLTPTATSHIGDDGAMVDKNFIGFHRLEGDGDAVDIVYKADGVTQVSFADAKTIAADTWYRFGLYFDGKRTLKFFIDGVEYATARLSYTALTASAFPSDVNLSPAVVGHKAATGTTEGSNLFRFVSFGYTKVQADLYP